MSTVIRRRTLSDFTEILDTEVGKVSQSRSFIYVYSIILVFLLAVGIYSVLNNFITSL
jgi:hypothetical protein